LPLTTKEILDDLKTINVEENILQQAREKVWNDYGKHYFLMVSSNV
jgi:hypothetical protein